MNPVCPHKLRKDLPPLIPRIAKLPVDERGYPVPFFVAWVDGKPEFRAADGEKRRRCFKEHLCWVCGEPMGTHKAFAIGPMCCVNRTTAEPPAHLDCAEWSVRGCPFLSKPQMVRREDEFLTENAIDLPGVPLLRNPGVTAIWVTKSYKMFWAGNGELVRVGEPEEVTWYREGRLATRAEVLAAIESGRPVLQEMADKQSTGAQAALESAVNQLVNYHLPKA